MTTLSPDPDPDQTGTNRWPVDSTTGLTMGGIPDDALDSLIAATVAPPVDLDPPEPLPAAIVRWTELVVSDQIETVHNGDAEKVMPMPRPLWADPDLDNVGAGRLDTYYSSARVRTPASLMTGWDDGTVLEHSRVNVSTRLWGSGDSGVVIQICKIGSKGKKDWSGIGLTADEAIEVAHALLAAADLLGSGHDGTPVDYDLDDPIQAVRFDLDRAHDQLEAALGYAADAINYLDAGDHRIRAAQLVATLDTTIKQLDDLRDLIGR